MRRRVSRNHCLTEYTVSREPRYHEIIEQIDEWVVDIHLVASTFGPSEEKVSGRYLSGDPSSPTVCLSY